MGDRKRIGKMLKGPQNVKNIRRFFLACEFKPNSTLFSVLDPFAYDIQPAYIKGKLGIIGYNPPTYSIVTASHDDDPLVGYLLTITEPDTIMLLDKIKGYNGSNAFNFHIRNLVHVFTDKTKVTTVWAYILSQYVLEAYQQIEQVEYGIWDTDDALQVALLEKIGMR